MNCISYVDAPAGAGKSHAMFEEIIKSNEQVVLVVPSIRLTDEIISHLRRLDPTLIPEVINSSEHHSVVKEIMKALDRPPKGKRLLIITWSAFLILPYFPNRKDWTVFIDEIPQIVTEETANVPKTHVHLTDHIEIHPVGAAYGRVLKKKKSGLRNVVSAQDDALKGKLTSMARTILSPYHETYVNLAAYDALLSGSGKQLSLFSIFNPRILDGFKKVTILGANFRASLLYIIWKSRGVPFKENTALSHGLRYQSHPNGPRLKIYYGITRPWSKAVRDQDDKRLLNAFVKASVDLMAGERFIWAANKDVSDTIISQENAVRLPQVAHGLNEFSTFHNVIYLSARNPPPNLIRFLGSRGVNPDDVRKAIHEEALYQTVMRSSLRDPNCDAPRRIVVPDESSALYLQRLFPGSELVKLDLGIDDPGPVKRRGRTKTFDDTAARVRAHREKQAKARSELAAVMAGEITTNSEGIAISKAFESMKKPCNENTFNEGERNVTPNSRGTVFDHLKATQPIVVVPDIEDDEFIKALKETYKKEYADKRENMLICPSVFDTSLSEKTSRGIDNVVYANGLWLDVDVGDMAHKDFAGLFPHVRMVVFNTFSSTRTQKRYRIYMPTTRTMTQHEYSSLSHQIVQIVEDAGFVHTPTQSHQKQKCHGIDKTKLSATSLFYLPCQPKDKSGSIWKDYKSGCRKPLNVDSWLEHAVPTVSIDVGINVPPHTSGDNGEVVINVALVEAAKTRWYTTGILKGNGDREIYRLAMDLRRAGLPIFDSKIALEEAARSATSPKDRLRQVKAIIRQYAKFWHG